MTDYTWNGSNGEFDTAADWSPAAAFVSAKEAVSDDAARLAHGLFLSN